MAKLLSNLKEVTISSCGGIQQVVSSTDDDGEMPNPSSSHTITTFFPHFHSLSLGWLKNLKHIGGGDAKDGSKLSEVGVVSWHLCQYTREIEIEHCDALSVVIPSYAIGQNQKLEKLKIRKCESLKEIFESQGTFNNNSGGRSTDVDEPMLENINVPQLSHLREIEISNCKRLEHVFTFSTLQSLTQLQKLKIEKCNAMKEIVKQETSGQQTMTSSDVVVFPRLKYVELIHLREIEIFSCKLLEYVFTFSTLESLRRLQKLKIKECKAMKEIVKQEINREQTTSNVVVFPYLKSVQLINLPNLLGFFLGKNDFDWKSLQEVVITDCPQVKVFTYGHSTAPNLNFITIHSSLDTNHVTECGLNFHEMATASQEKPWSYQNLVKVEYVEDQDVIKLIPSNKLQQLKMLKRIKVNKCYKVEEIFEVALEGTNTTVDIPNLTKVVLWKLPKLKYIWKNNQGMVLQFPNLTTLEIFKCNSLKHVFTSSVVGSILQLQKLEITDNDNIEVIVKEEEEECCDGKVKPIELPRLKSLILSDLPSLKGFCLGKDAFSFPSLDTLQINECPKLTVFINGCSITPKLKRIEMADDMYHLKGDLNAFINTKQQEGVKF